MSASRFCPADVTRGALLPVCFVSLLMVLLQPAALRGQAPVALANTATSVAGGGAAISAGASCPSNSQYKAADTYGNGCTGGNANFSVDMRGGLASDGQGNIYIADTGNNMIRKYDPKTSVISRVAGKGTNCGTANGQQDGSGDGCPAQQTSLVSTPRGIATDPYGNVLFAGYGTQMVHVICEAASPLCPNTTGTKQVGYMYRVAGCVATAGGNATAGSGTTAGSEGDGTAASPFNNLSSTDTALNGGTTSTGTCSASVGEVNQPRGVGADKWGNVYIGETAVGRWRVVLGPQTSTYFTGTNPLWALIAMNPTYAAATLHQGYIYPLLNGFTAQTANGITYNVPTAAASACQSGTGASTAVSTDAYGDGCQYFATAATSNTSNVQGVTADNYGNIYFADANALQVRAIYGGGANAAANPLYAALVAEGVTTPTQGFVYTLVGGGVTGVSTTPTLGNATAISSAYKVVVGPNNNIYIGDTGSTAVEMLDVATGYVRVLFKSGTPCAAHVNGSSNGDGCPSGSFSFNTANGTGIAVDPLGNVYVTDQNGSSGTPYIRKVEAVSLPRVVMGSVTAAGSSYTQTLKFHGPAGTASMTATALNTATDIALGTVTCGSANADTTMDCTVPVTFTPTQPGYRSMNLQITASNGSNTTLGSAVFPVAGVGVGSALVADLATPNAFSITGYTPVGIALDGASNGYFVDTVSGKLIKALSGGGISSIGTAPAGASQIAVDVLGNVYVASASNATVTKFTLGTTGTYTSSLFATGVSNPQAVAVDPSGNVYVADKATGSVVEIAANVYPASQAAQTIASGFTNPVGLAFDTNGFLYVADSGAPGVFRITNVNGVATTSLYAAGSALNVTATPGTTPASTAPTVTVSGLTPTAVAADPGSNVYVQDSTSKSVILIPLSTTSATSIPILTGLATPSGLGVDTSGVLYSADSGGATPQIVQVKRNKSSFAFGSSSGTANAVSGYFGNAGNGASTGWSVTTSAEFLFDQTGTYTCGTIPSSSNTLAAGANCSFTAYFNPATTGNAVTSVTNMQPSTATTGNFTLSGQEPVGVSYATSIGISAPTPSSPKYVATGYTASFTVTVSATGTTDTPSGSVSVTTSCTGGSGSYTLTNGSATVQVAGCTAGSQSLSVSYANTPDSQTANASFAASSNSTSFTVAQAGTQLTWTPAATSIQYSTAVGNSVLNAVASATGGGAIAGYYMYTATPTGGAAATIHAASYLPIGTYTLGVTFVPADSVDYAQSTASVPNFTVTKASTTAPVGASQFVVASDGTGNYTSVQTAVNALGANGGSVYIKPGTYTGDVMVVQPTVSLRGLGGDPTQVILTHAGGAFGAASGVQAYAGEFTVAMMNGSQLPAGSTVLTGDQGSATLAVSKGINTAISPSSLTPNNFYAENFTVQNTYDTDNVTTTTTYVSGGNCTANAGSAQTYFALYNQGLLCASQALALYSTSDLAVINNVYATSLQDTVCLGSCGRNGLGYPSRLYWFRGKVTGNVDYIFGDGAAVFDYTTIYNMQNKSGGTGGAGTLHAQSQATQTGASGYYISGFVMNNNVFTSQTNNTYFYFGRPYGAYSTFIMLNGQVDEVMPAGYEEFSGQSNLPTSTFAEYNTQAYTDPATGALDPNGVVYQGSATYSGYGVLSTSTPPAARETTSQDPGTVMSGNSVRTTLTAAQATYYYPTAFLGTNVSGTYSTTQSWVPTQTLAAEVNAFVPPGSTATITLGDSITILMRPQTPGLGATGNGSYTIPTGTYTLYDNGNVLASGSLDATGEAYLTTTSLSKGSHSLTWTYGGDSNFSGSTTSTPLVITVNGKPTTTTLGLTVSPITYGQSAALTATVSPSSGTGTPTGTVQAKVDGTTSQNGTLSSGATSFSFTGLTGGSHSFVGTYGGDTTYAGSTSSSLPLTVNPAPLTATGYCSGRVYGAANACSAGVNGYQYSDTAATVFSSTPTGTTTATRVSPPGTYTATTLGSSLTLTTFGSTNYTVSSQTSTFTISGGAVQSIIFPPLPNFSSGHSYQLTAHATSGLPVVYTVTSGNASVSGATLTVTGTGAVTVQATCTDASGAYATATPVSRSFTAQ